MASHPGDKTSDSLKRSKDRHAQSNDDIDSVAGDPNMAGWPETQQLLDPISGPLAPSFDNDCYRDFFLQQRLPDSQLHGYGPEQTYAAIPSKDYSQTGDKRSGAFGTPSATGIGD